MTFGMKLFAQGDLLFERIDGLLPGATVTESGAAAPIVLLHGEKSGHCHALHGSATVVRDVELARDIPGGLYVGHVKVSGSALLTHQEHAAIALSEGLYRVRRQRLFDPAAAAAVED